MYRAIWATVFWAVGCSPDLGRGEGSVTLSVVDVPPGVDTLRAHLDHEGWRYQAEAPAQSGSGTLLIESVPAGPLSVTVQGLGGGVVVRERTVTTEIEAGRMHAVPVSLREGGGDEVRSAPLAVRLRNLQPSDLKEGKLEAKAHFEEGVVATFLDSAASTLGGPVGTLSAETLALQLHQPAVMIDSLTDLWSGSLKVILESEQVEIEIARGVVPQGLEAVIPVTTNNLNPLLSALRSGEAELELEGATPLMVGDDFSADVSAFITFIARR